MAIAHVRNQRRSDAVAVSNGPRIAYLGAFGRMARLMATKVRIELLSDGIRDLLMSQPIAAECEKAAEEIATRAGDGFEVKPLRRMNFGGGRIGYAVHAETYEAKLSEAQDKTLSKAVRG